MSPATSMFRSHLREAVRDAQTSSMQAPGVTPLKSVPARPVRRTVVRLWLPLTPLWIILSPFAILAAPLLLLLAPQTRGIRPFRAVFALGGLLFALSGTVVDVDTPDALVRLHLY